MRVRVQRMTALGAIALLGAVLAGCGGTSSSGLPSQTTASTAPPTTAPPATTPATTAPPTTSPASSTTPATTAPPTTTPATTTPTTASPTSGSVSDGIGATQKVSMADKALGDTNANVTLESIVDPGQPKQFEAPPGGSRLVVAKLGVAALGTISDDADSDSSLLGSNGQTYQTSFDGVVGCTDFNDGEVTMKAGQTQTGCVVFQLPKNVMPKQFSFGDELGQVAHWQLDKLATGGPSPAVLTLTLGDLPSGWVDGGLATNTGSGGESGCPGVQTSKTIGDVYSHQFQSANGLQNASSDVSVAPSAAAAKSDLAIFSSAKGAACARQLAQKGGGSSLAITSVQRLSFSGPGIPAQSTGYRFNVNITTDGKVVPAILDVAVFTAGRLEAELEFVGVQAAVPASTEVHALAAMAKAG